METQAENRRVDTVAEEGVGAQYQNTDITVWKTARQWEARMEATHGTLR